ncbi:MAG: Rpp14/Pop5 family protein [Candidatus Micrarchaeota archaeon]
MKPYPPTMREKRRYIVLKAEAESLTVKFTKEEIERALKTAAFEWLGILGVVETGFWVISADEREQEAVVRCNHESIDRVQAVMCLIDRVNNKKARFHTLNVTGTIKKANSS